MTFLELNEKQKGFFALYTVLVICVFYYLTSDQLDRIDAKLTRERQARHYRERRRAEQRQEREELLKEHRDKFIDDAEEEDVVNVEPNVGRAREDLGPATGPNGSIERCHGNEEGDDRDPEERLEEIASEGVQDTVDEIEAEGVDG